MSTVWLVYVGVAGIFLVVIACTIAYSVISKRDLFSRTHVITRRSRLMWWLYLSLSSALFINGLAQLVPDQFAALRLALEVVAVLALDVCVITLFRLAARPG